MTSSRQEEELLYEQQEVLWAKIRGYPWWPAFVDKVHVPVRGKQSEYTVFFFGDNTQYPSSKLGASKLRKFYENYTEFYQKARAHRKLMTSIQMAEEKLKQNDQNVEIFEELRNNLKIVKKDRPKSPLDRKQSKISEPEPELSPQKEEPPELNKSKTYAHPRGRRSLTHKEQEQAVIHEQLSSHKNKVSPAKQQIPVPRQPDKTVKKPLRKQDTAPTPPKRKRAAKQQIFEELQQPKSTNVQLKELKVASPQKEESVQKIVEEEAKQQAEQSEMVEAKSESIEEEGQSDESEDIVYEKKLRNKVNRNSQDHQKTSSGQRKRGRPKKRLLRHHAHPEERAELPTRAQNNRITHQKRKIIHKVRPSPRKAEATASSLSQSDHMMIEHVRRILPHRDELIEYLGSISITINNVQEILDLGVSNILQDGQKTPKITEILFVLRNVLLYKYFPEDVKHRKKYEQILRRKPVLIKNDEKERKEQSEEQAGQAREGKERGEEGNDQSIRKKTIVKLQKFLKAHPDVQSKARQLAVKIESYFQKADREVGETYKSLAYKVLSSLKERKQSCSEVMKKLDHHAYD